MVDSLNSFLLKGKKVKGTDSEVITCDDGEVRSGDDFNVSTKWKNITRVGHGVNIIVNFVGL